MGVRTYQVRLYGCCLGTRRAVPSPPVTAQRTLELAPWLAVRRLVQVRVQVRVQVLVQGLVQGVIPTRLGQRPVEE